MPWSIRRKEDEWCVIKDDDGSSAGCHATRERALRQQRALYAQEAQTASVAPEENGGPMRVEIAAATTSADEALLASISALTERLEKADEVMTAMVDALGKVVETQNADRAALTQALTAAANQPEPVVNVYVPEIVVPEQPPATVNVHVPKSKIMIPASPTPIVNITMPGSKKTVKFTRNLNGEVESADIVEELDGG
jgi:hypothetical protein